MNRAIGYIRVSTDDQAEHGISLEVQRTKIRQYCDLNDMDLVEIIEDAGISAKNITGRPGFQRALQKLRGGQASALVIYKLDRAFRSTVDALEVAQEMNKSGRALHSVMEKLDTASAIGEFFFTLLASLAQMERRLIGERTAAAMRQKKANGEKISSQAPYGYRYEHGIAVLVPEEQRCLAVLRDVKEQVPDSSLSELARFLTANGYLNRNGKPFDHSSLRKMLQGEAP